MVPAYVLDVLRRSVLGGLLEPWTQVVEDLIGVAPLALLSSSVHVQSAHR
jgi:hypothetical protein